MDLAPVLVFVYKRPDHTLNAIEALRKNLLSHGTDLFIYSDGAKSLEDEPLVYEVRQIVRKIYGFKSVTLIERNKNYGLASNIKLGVGEILEKYNKVIVVEDDLITSARFLNFMNYCLDAYENKPQVMSITGFNYPDSKLKLPKDYVYDVYFSKRNSSWGWATWKSSWEKINWDIDDIAGQLKLKEEKGAFELGGSDLTRLVLQQQRGEISSWSIYFTFAHFKERALAVYPVRSFVENNGFDGTGEHCLPEEEIINDPLNQKKNYSLPLEITPDERIIEGFKKVFEPLPLITRICRKLLNASNRSFLK